jgi:hypothetical protein
MHFLDDYEVIKMDEATAFIEKTNDFFKDRKLGAILRTKLFLKMLV